MNFLKKLIGKEEAPAKAKTFAHAQRFPRVMILPLHRITFTPADSSLQKTFDLGNISSGGMALMCEGPSDFLKKDQLISGSLLINQNSIAVAARIKHISQILAGCEFSEPSATLREAIRNYLRVEISALNLRKVNEAYMKPDPRGQAVWYSDGRNGELYAVSNANQVIHFHMSFLGYYLEGGSGKTVRGGLIKSEDQSEQPEHKGSDLVDLGKNLDPDVALLASRFVQNIESLPENIAADLCAQIEKPI